MRASPPLWVAGAATLITSMTLACGLPLVDRSDPPAPSETDDEQLVPPGYGTLRQEQVTLSLRRDDLLVKVTPLAESVIRVTAPDTYERLSGLKRSHRPALLRTADDTGLFLVSFFSYEPDVPFQPEDVHLLNGGLRFRPLGISSVTPGWGVQRLRQEETQMALYAYGPAVDLERELAVEYRQARRGGWDRILQRLQAERARVRSRVGSDPGRVGDRRDREARTPANGASSTHFF